MEIFEPSRWGTVSGVTVRLFLAALAGLILGYPSRNRPGGVRLHLMVTLGAALFCNTALRFMGSHDGDVLRAVQGVVSGIGFIGAASVLRQGTSVIGLTSAATIWIAAALGCEAGLGDPFLTIVLAPIVSTLNVGSRLLERRFRRRTSARKKLQREQP